LGKNKQQQKADSCCRDALEKGLNYKEHGQRTIFKS